MKQLPIDIIRTFVTVIDLGGFAKAGEVLGKSQPAVSLQIKKLEDQLGVSLFTKQGQRQIVNEAGKELYAMAQNLLRQNDQILAHFAEAPLAGNVRLGIPSEFATSLLPSIIGAFASTYPEVTLEVVSALSSDLIRQHKLKAFDVLLFIGEHEDDPDAQFLISDELVWAGTTQQAEMQLNAEEKLKLVLAPPGCRYRERALQRLAGTDIDWQISFTNTDLTGIAAAIGAGLGITVLAKSTLPKDLTVLKTSALPTLGSINIHITLGDNRHPMVSKKLAGFIYEKMQLSV